MGSSATAALEEWVMMLLAENAQYLEEERLQAANQMVHGEV